MGLWSLFTRPLNPVEKYVAVVLKSVEKQFFCRDAGRSKLLAARALVVASVFAF